MTTTSNLFDAFISYRRSDGSRLARWLRRKLQTYKPSREVSARLPNDVRLRLARGLSVFLDTSNARTTKDFWSSQILHSLERSRYLLVLSTPDAIQRSQDGAPDWIEREIDTFSKFDDGVARIIPALGPRAPINPLPGRLSELSSRWGWADLRSWTPFYRLSRKAATVDEAFIDILATLADLPADLVPVLREEERRSRSALRRRTALISAAVLAVVGGSSWFGYQQWLSSKANATWSGLQFFSSDLTPIDLVVLQNLSEQPEAVKFAFVAKARESSTNSNKLLRHPGALLRAVGLQPTSQEIELLLEPILPLIKPETHPVELDYVLQAIRALSPEFTQAQADAVLLRLLNILKTLKPQVNDTTLLPVLTAVAVKLSTDQVSAALAQAVAALQQATLSPQVVHSLALFVSAMPGASNQKYLKTVQNIILQQFEAAGSSQDALHLSQALAALPGKLSAEQQMTVVQLLFGLRQKPGFDADVEAYAVRALTTKLHGEAAQAVFQSSIESLRRTGDRYRSWPAAEVLTVISTELTLPQVNAAYKEVLTKISSADDPGALVVLGKALKALAPHMKEQANALAALNASIAILSTDTNSHRFRAIAQGIGTIHPTDEQATSMIGSVIASAKRISGDIPRGDELQAVDEAVPDILSTFNAQQLRLASTETIKEFRATPDRFAGWVYAGILAVGAQRQAIEDVPALLSFTLDRLRNRSQDAFAIRAPARVIKSLSPSLTEAQVREVRARLTEVFAGVGNPLDLEALAAVSCSLPVRARSEEARPAFDAILSTVRGNKDVNRPPDSAEALGAIGCELSQGQQATAFAAASDRLAVAGDQDDAKTWSETAEALLRSTPDPAYVGGVLGLLKYPSSAGGATRSLLDKLRNRFADAPSSPNGLAVVARWAQQRFPAVDVNGPPKRVALPTDQVPQRSVLGRVPQG